MKMRLPQSSTTVTEARAELTQMRLAPYETAEPLGCAGSQDTWAREDDLARLSNVDTTIVANARLRQGIEIRPARNSIGVGVVLLNDL